MLSFGPVLVLVVVVPSAPMRAGSLSLRDVSNCFGRRGRAGGARGGGMVHSGSGTVLRGRGAGRIRVCRHGGGGGPGQSQQPGGPRFPQEAEAVRCLAARRHAEQLRLGQQFARVFEGGLGTFVAHHARQLLHAILG